MIDKSINKSLGLPIDYNISVNDAFKIRDRFSECIFGDSSKFSNISFIYYEEKFGSFLKPKNHLDIIVKDIFNNLNNEDKFELLTYFSSEEK